MEIELVVEKTNTEKRVLFKYDCVPYYSFPQSQNSGNEWKGTTKEKFCDVLNYSSLRVREIVNQLMIAVGQLARLLTFLNGSWSFESTSRCQLVDHQMP